MLQLPIRRTEDSHIITVREPTAARRPKFSEFWAFRYLLWTLVRRDLKVRYRHTLLGILWFVVQPLALMLVITVGLRFVFPGEILGLPYAAYVASGLVVWVYFANAFPAGAASLETYQAILNKIYIPKAILPLVPVLTAFADLLSASVLLAPVLFYYGIAPSWRLIFVPVVCLGLMLAVYGMALWASAAAARYKDLRQLVPFLAQLLFFASPVFISQHLLEGKARLLLQLNPLAAYIDAFRWCVFPSVPPPALDSVSIAVGVSFALFVSGIFFFQRQQANVVDTL